MIPLSQEPLPRLAPRAPDSHKGTFGRALIVAGSRGMSGAPALAGMAALRGGAGLVQVAVPASILGVVAGFEPSYLTAELAEDAAGRIAQSAAGRLREIATSATAVGVGPGLGQSDDLAEVVCGLYRDLPQPAVFDADALNLLARTPFAFGEPPKGPRILTPHPGEFARLIGQSLSGVAAQESADELARRSGAVVLLKGHRTYITDGRRAAENATGNPGMATGGTGDVLTGLVVALLCQGLPPWEAARCGAQVHGLAGDLAAAELGQVSLIASDLVDYLPTAFQHWLAPKAPPLTNS